MLCSFTVYISHCLLVREQLHDMAVLRATLFSHAERVYSNSQVVDTKCFLARFAQRNATNSRVALVCSRRHKWSTSKILTIAFRSVSFLPRRGRSEDLQANSKEQFTRPSENLVVSIYQCLTPIHTQCLGSFQSKFSVTQTPPDS